MPLCFSSRMCGETNTGRKILESSSALRAHLQLALRACQSHTWNYSQILSFHLLSNHFWPRFAKFFWKSKIFLSLFSLSFKWPCILPQELSAWCPGQCLVEENGAACGLPFSPRQTDKLRWSSLEMERNEKSKGNRWPFL